MGTVVSLKGFKIGDFILKNNILVILVLLFTSGLMVGIFTEAKIAMLNEYSLSFLERFISKRTDTAFLSVVFGSFMNSLLVLLLTFTAGTSMLGVVLVPMLAMFRGILYGGVSALLYSDYSVKGIAFNAVLIIPSAIVFIIALLLASRESVKFSLLIAKQSLPSAPPINLSYDFKNYCGRYIFISLIALASAIIDAVLSSSFMANLTL